MNIIYEELCPICDGKEFIYIGKTGKIFMWCPICDKGFIKVKYKVDE